MSDFNYQQFVVHSKAVDGIILYRSDKPIAIFINSGPDKNANFVRFILETLDISVRGMIQFVSEEAIALIEKETKENSNLLPTLPFPKELLKTHFSG